ncbi:COMM domain-containing protein 2 [Euwallacea fornicatus]|uniref:COMM domain-containing protein 2 n=1 Tax=Euwallacea fornicatus TaxID=995702 RepID=UPI0033901A1C
MLISLRNDHRDHLKLLLSQPEQVVADFCKLTVDYIQKGPSPKLYNTAASKLNVTPDAILNCVYGLVNLLLVAYKHQLSEADFRDSLLTLGFSEELTPILIQFYEKNKSEVLKLKSRGLSEPHYDDLQWRLEVQLGSRALLEQVTPLIAMDLTLKTEQGAEAHIEHKLLQTDITNLLHIANELEKALSESRSRHSRKVQRVLSNYTQNG